MTKRTKNTKRGAKSTNKSKRYVGGDIPPPRMYTHHTQSCALPRITEYAVVRGTANAVITASASIDVKTNYAFQMANANVNTGYFDQYRIAAIRFVAAAQNNAIGLVTNSTTSIVPMYIVLDFDDASNLASVAAAEAYSNCLVLHPGESCERIFKPRVAVGAYTGSVFTGFANMPDLWIDSASTNVQHYGVKTIVPAATAAQTLLQTWDISIEYFIEMRKAI
jgi:hypothetical protein